MLGLHILVAVSARFFVPAATPPSAVYSTLHPPVQSPNAVRVAPVLLKASGEVRSPSWVFPLFAVLTAGFLSAATPTITQASVEPPGVVQQYGSSMIAGNDDDLSERQKEFLEQRQKLKQTYEEDYDGNFKSGEEVVDKKNIYTTIVVGLIVIAFVAPMVQFFYYTGGD
jgi:hypothetical protein